MATKGNDMSIAKRHYEEQHEKAIAAAESDFPVDIFSEEEETRQAIPEDDRLRQLANLADHYLTTEAEIADMEEKLKVLNERFRKIREDFIPEKMMELGVKSYKLTDGSTIGYSSFYAGKVLKDEGYDWLEQNGYADAVKQELKLETSRVDSDALEEIKKFIFMRDFDNLSVKEKQAIHHMTLGSVIKALTKRGEQLPPDLIETYIGNRATIKKGQDNG
jgi:hypothetical protein